MVIAIFVAFMLCISSTVEAQQLQVGFYDNTCGVVEEIVRDEVKKAVFRDRGIAAGLIRMHFHDCFVRGCDASIMINSTANNTAEIDGPPNGISLRGFEVIENAKARLESACRGVVSCADILTFAARESVLASGGVGWDVPAGRRDGRVSIAAETLTNLPPPFFNLSQLTQSFAAKGFTQEEMVVLSGAHTIGRSHCTSFSNRLYNFSPTQSQDPTLSPPYAAQLKQQCPANQQGNVDPNLVVQMSATPAELDTTYYREILNSKGLFTSDQSLTSSAVTADQVKEYAFRPFHWKIDFAAAMLKMGNISVLTGTNGEIRANCRVINP